MLQLERGRPETRTPPGRGAALISVADEANERYANTSDTPLVQARPAWVPELVAVLTELHRRRAARFAFYQMFAWERIGGHYPDQPA